MKEDRRTETFRSANAAHDELAEGERDHKSCVRQWMYEVVISTDDHDHKQAIHAP